MLSIALGIRNIPSRLLNLVYALLCRLNAATVGLIALAAVQLPARHITCQMSRFLICVTACAGLLYRGPLIRRTLISLWLCGTSHAHGCLWNCNGDFDSRIVRNGLKKIRNKLRHNRSQQFEVG
jgi:hypothetical protein